MPDFNNFFDLNATWQFTTADATIWNDTATTVVEYHPLEWIEYRPLHWGSKGIYNNYYDKYTFRKGQKIVCKVDDSIDSFVNTGYGIEKYEISQLIKNKVYTVRNITFCACGKEKIALEDIVNEQEDAYFKCSCGSSRFSLHFDTEWFEKYVVKGYEDYTTEQLKSYDFQKEFMTEFPERYKDIEPYLIPKIKEEFKELIEMF